MHPINKVQILKKAEELAKSISEQEEVELYQRAEAQIKNHRKIQEIITQIKKKQQELVNAKHLKKNNYIQQLEAELDELNKELHDSPLVYQYQQSQKDLNKYVQTIIKLLKEQLASEINLDSEDSPDPKLNQLSQFKL